MPEINIKNLTKAYPLDLVATLRSVRDAIMGRSQDTAITRSKVALDDVSLHMDSGERVGIVGRNGAGKSTLLHLIAGVGDPTSGTLAIDGHVTSILTLGVGMQEGMSGRENIYLDAEVQGRSRAEVDRVIDAIIDFADLGEFIDRPVRTYSTGMKSRLAFAMISHIEPEILLIDEALSVGDASFAIKASQRIRKICASGKIVVVVSHSMGAIQRICNRCIWLDNGRVVLDGKPAEVTAAYLQAVRREEDGQLLKKFRGQLTSETLAEGFAITMLESRAEGSDSARTVLPAEHGQRICIEGTVGKLNSSATIRLKVERIDELLLIDDAMELQVEETSEGIGLFSVQAELPRALAHGIYRLEASIVQRSETLARKATVVELTADDPPSGGRPALFSPYSVSFVAMTESHAGI